jgi:hypothetical protein
MSLSQIETTKLNLQKIVRNKTRGLNMLILGSSPFLRVARNGNNTILNSALHYLFHIEKYTS